MMWIIEPHADDAYLSLHEHIVGPWRERSKTILTVFNTPQRFREAQSYAEAVGCEYKSLMLKEGGGLSKSAGQVSPFSQWNVGIGKYDILVFPLGIQHPDHLTVRAQAPASPRVWFYLDTPYYAKLKLGDEVRAALQGMEVRSFCYASQRKWKHIEKFKSQGKYFFHHPPESLPRMELVLSNA